MKELLAADLNGLMLFPTILQATNDEFTNHQHVQV
jgi:hypothetical protein